jgi:hypothetical protein
MKRFVLILPSILSLGFLGAADNVVTEAQIVSNAVKVESVIPKVEPVIFQDASFFTHNAPMLNSDFIKWIYGEDGSFTSQLKKQVKKHVSILPIVEISGYENTTLSEAIRALGHDSEGNDKKLNMLKVQTFVDADFSSHKIFGQFIEKVTATIEDGSVRLTIGRKGEKGTDYQNFKPNLDIAGKAQTLLIDKQRAYVFVGLDSGSIIPFDLNTSNYCYEEVFSMQRSPIKLLGFHDNGNILVSLSNNEKLCFYHIKDKTCRIFMDAKKTPFKNIYAGEKNLCLSHGIQKNIMARRFYDGDLCIETPIAYIKNKVFDTKNGALFIYGLYLALQNKKFEELKEVQEVVELNGNGIRLGTSFVEAKNSRSITSSMVLQYLYNSDELLGYGDKTVQPVIKSVIAAKAKDYKVDLKAII